MLLPFADRVAVSYPELSSGAVARYLGLLAAAMERWETPSGTSRTRWS